jgi:hypothetical protein
MNKLIQLFEEYKELNGVRFKSATYAILETPCYPASFYFGSANLVQGPHDRIGEWYTGNNATSNFHRSLDEAQAEARKMFPPPCQKDVEEIAILVHEGNLDTAQLRFDQVAKDNKLKDYEALMLSKKIKARVKELSLPQNTKKTT